MKSCPECGAIFTKRRSAADHRRFFALLAAARLQWPHSHAFQAASDDAFRAWLLIRAGHIDVEHVAYPTYCDTTTAKTIFRAAVESTHAAMDRRRPYSETRVSAHGIDLITARSIDWRTLSQKEFGPIREACEQIIEEIVGVEADRLLKERAA